jgi:hypothetical protein
MSEGNSLLRETVIALQELTKTFAWERRLYLGFTIVSFVILLVVLGSLFVESRVSWLQVFANFGSSGVVAMTAGRVSFLLNRSFDVIHEVAKGLAANRVS